MVCTSFTDLSDSRVKTEIAKADVAELLQLFNSVEAKQPGHEREPGWASAGRLKAGRRAQVNMEALRDLADDFNVRDPRKLLASSA